MSALLEVSDLRRHFGGVVAVDDVSFSLHTGDVLGLIGPNGAGKTTIVNVVTGYFPPTEGTVLFDGQPTVGAPPHHLAGRGLARTFQHLRLFDGVSVLDNVLIGRHLSYRDRRWNLWVKRRAEERTQRDEAMAVLEQLALADHADADVSSLPYGLRRRVEIARALATRPRLLLLDEPTAGMTRSESDDIGSLIQELRGGGLSILLVDHNVRLVSEACNRVAVIDWGRVVTEGSPEEVWADQRVKEAYLGVRATRQAEVPT